MRPRYSFEYLERTYGGQSVFDLWSLLTTLEQHVVLPERSWLFCRLIEWMSTTRSGVWTYYDATPEKLQTEVSGALRRYPELHAISEYYDLGMRTWKSEQEIGQVDQWLDSQESQLHAIIMQVAREEKAHVTEINSEQPGTGQPATRPVDEPDGSETTQPEAEGRSR